MPKILIIEASRAIRNSLRERLEYEKHTVEVAEKIEEAFEIMHRFIPDVVLCDRLHGREVEFPCPFIVISDDSSVGNVVNTVRAGALDFIPKPVDINYLFDSIANVITHSAEKRERYQPPPDTRPPNQPGDVYTKMVGDSASMVNLRNLIERIAPSSARVLITGENGTGKELVARMLHTLSRRVKAPFIEINCAAIPSELIESELFGHEKGAFTSAIRQSQGKFEQATGGTLFMDEIGDMSLPAQAKVLRALQEGRISRVGSNKYLHVDVRVVAATNKDLLKEIEKGAFREDLYHRLSVITIHVPPLRERTEDIPGLVDHFNKTICREYGITQKEFSAESIEELRKIPWRGNVRELHNVVERLIVLGSDHISIEDVYTHVSRKMVSIV